MKKELTNLKQTPLGTIPEEWEVKPLGDVLEITSSKRIFMSEYVASGVPFYRGKEVVEKAKGDRNISTPLYISEKRYSEITDKYGAPQENDILMSSVGTLGVSYQVEKGERFYFKDGNLTWFRNYTKDIWPKFIHYWLKSSYGQRSILSAAIGSTQPALTIDGLKKITLAIPTKQEQQKIASILSSLDDKIELNRQMNATLEKIAGELFKRWFVEFGDELPEGWRIGMLSEVSDITIGRTPPRMESEWFSINPNDRKWISIRDMGNCGVYINQTAEYLTQTAVDRFKIPVIPKNTVVTSFKLTVGRIAITAGEMLSNEAIAHIKLKEKVLSPEYIYLALKLFDFTSLGSTSSIATAVNSKSIKEIPILIPDEKVVVKFDALIKPLFDHIMQNTRQLDSLVQVRDSLLPRLMSGKVRVPYNANIFAK